MPMPTTTSPGHLPAVVRRPTFRLMVTRAATFRCPVCGGWRAWFRGWFAKRETCASCEFAWRRGMDGFETGSMIINFILTFGALGVGLAVGIATTYPDTPTGPLLAVLLPMAALLPLVLFPFTNLLWSAIELTMHPLEAGEVAVLPDRVRAEIIDRGVARANT